MTNAKIAVLGAGPAGLAAAYAAAAAGADVDVFEASVAVGGSLFSRRINMENPASFAFDMGASSMQLKYAPVAKLITEELDLQGSILERRAQGHKAYIVRKGSLFPLPTNPVEILTSGLLTFRGKMSIFLEPFARRLKNGDAARKETVRGFFHRRFSTDVADYIVDPAVAGVFSGDPAKMSMRWAMPSLWHLERDKGSILLPIITAKKNGDDMALNRSITFEGGMQTLPRAMLEGLKKNGGKLRAGTRVRSITRGEAGHWHVNRRGEYDAVICAIPAHALGEVNSNIPLIQEAFSKLAKRVRYAAVGVVTLGFRREQVAHKLDGFGVLVPAKEKRTLLGVQFASEGYPEKSRSEEERDKVFLSVYLGGVRNPEVLASKNGVLAAAQQEVEELLGVQDEPYFSKVHVWKQGIPQYAVSHSVIRRTKRLVEKKAPGLLLTGNYMDGVGVADAILSGLEAAKMALQYFEKLEKLNDPSKPGWSVGD